MSKTPFTDSVSRSKVLEELPVITESTTSRILIDNEILQVTYFVFDEGQSLSTHSSPKAVVVTLLTGEMEFIVEGKTTIMKPGDCIYLAPKAPHSLTALSKCHLSLVMVDAKPWINN